MGRRKRLAGPRVAFSALCIAITTAGCGGGDSSGASAHGSPGTAIPSSRPQIEVPEGLPPKKLVIKDLRKGTGAEADTGDEVELDYYGVNWKNGTEQANSWRSSNAPTFVLGEHRLLRGLNLAVPGMREGGGREVLIPPKLVYYPGHGPRNVRPLDALVFKVYLIKVLKKKR